MYSIIPRLTPLLPGLISYIGSAVCILCNLYDQLQCLNSPIHWITLLPFWNFLQILALRRLWMAPLLSVSFTPKKHICLLVAWSKHSDGLKLLKHTFKPMRRDCWRTTCMLLAELPFIIVGWIWRSSGSAPNSNSTQWSSTLRSSVTDILLHCLW